MTEETTAKREKAKKENEFCPYCNAEGIEVFKEWEDRAGGLLFECSICGTLFDRATLHKMTIEAEAKRRLLDASHT